MALSTQHSALSTQHSALSTIVIVALTTGCPSDEAAEADTDTDGTTGTVDPTIPTTTDTTCDVEPVNLEEEDEAGDWSAVVDWSTTALTSLITCEVPPCDIGPGFIAAHAVHLPTGKILFWDGVTDQYLYDITTGTFEWVPAIYDRTACAFDEKVDCQTDNDCEEYCLLPNQNNPNCDGTPDLSCLLLTLSDIDLFCAAHVHGFDGNVIMAGGNITGSPDAYGKREISHFDRNSKQWTHVPGGTTFGYRWYPSLAQLSDGRVFILGGDGYNDVEIYSPWLSEDAVAINQLGFPADLSAVAQGSSINGLQYPLIFQVQLGLVFYAGAEALSNELYYQGYLFDTQITGNWLTHTSAIGTSPGGSGVQYQPSKIMRAGGCASSLNRCQPVATTEIIDLTGVSPNQEMPNFRAVCPMQQARHFHTLTILPDGTVLATGGNSDGNGHEASYCGGGAGFDLCNPMNGDADCTVGRCGPQLNFQACDMMNPCPDDLPCYTAGGTCELYNNDSFATKSAELWNPVTHQWTTLKSQANPRMYHSTALLLPDGRVLSAGGGKRSDDVTDQQNAEFFSPPYLFKGTRPTIMSLPEAVNYGIPFEVTLGNMTSEDIARVTLVRLASVTHGFDMEQRFFELTFSRPLPNRLRVDVPMAKPEISPVPAGWYMLFVLTEDGVPSIVEYVRVLAE